MSIARSYWKQLCRHSYWTILLLAILAPGCGNRSPVDRDPDNGTLPSTIIEPDIPIDPPPPDDTTPDNDDALIEPAEAPDSESVNRPPVADGGPDQTVAPGDAVMLDGFESYDPDGDPITMTWRREADGGPAVALSQTLDGVGHFVAPDVSEDAMLVFALVVSDGALTTEDIVIVDVVTTFATASTGPVADAGSHQTVRAGDTVTLDGTGSAAGDGGALSYRWTQVGGPSVQLGDETSALTVFAAPPVAGESEALSFVLGVTEGDLLAFDDTVVTVLPGTGAPPLAAPPTTPPPTPDCTGNADCDDGVYCNGAETCTAETCQAGTAPCAGSLCDETADACVECLADGDCDNGQYCDGVESCVGGSCVPGNGPCPGQFCDTVDQACAECLVDADCDNGLFCDGNETCNSGVCVAGLLACPSSLCNESTDVCFTQGCSTDPNCDDGFFCNGAETCQGNTCVTGASPCAGQLCDESGDACVECLVHADCADGTFCNGSEQCTGGICSTGANPCPGQICHEPSDACVDCVDHGDCSDGVFCNGAEVCADSSCFSGNDPCPTMMCNENAQACVECLDASDCDDGVYCNGAEPCLAGICAPGSYPCTGQGCDEAVDTCYAYPEVRFSLSPDTGTAPLTVTATAATVSGDPLPSGLYIWNFDGAVETGSVSSHSQRTHVFNQGGVHTVTLTLTLVGLTAPLACVSSQTDEIQGRIYVLPTISGVVLDENGQGIVNATISGTAGVASPATTAADGSYQVTVPYDWSGTISVQHAGYAFSPASRAYSSVVTDGALQNYTGIAQVPNGLPLDLRGSTPEQGTLTITLPSIPGDATALDLVMTVFDADFATEGRLFVNGHGPVTLFGTLADEQLNDAISITLDPIRTDIGWYHAGDNTLTFWHDNTSGYVIEAIITSFVTSSPQCGVDPDCSDGLFCNGTERCNAGACVSGTNPCQAGETCNETADTCEPAVAECISDPECDDGVFCNGVERCVGQSCGAGTFPCQTGEVCVEATNQCTPAPENTYFVDINHPSASDNNPGTESLPFMNPQAPADIAQPGDTVLIKAGTYRTTGNRNNLRNWFTVIEMTRSGTAANPIVFQAYRNPDGRYDTVILDAEDTFFQAVHVHDCEYIIFDGLTMTGGTKSGIRLGAGNGSTAPFLDPVSNITVRNCVAYDNAPDGVWTPAFWVTGGSHHIRFEHCESFRNGGGFWAGVPHHAIKAEQPNNVVWELCLAYDNTKGGGNSMGFALYGAHDSTMTRCVAYGNSDTGAGSQGPHCDNNVFEDVVAFAATSAGNGRGFQFNNTSESLLLSGLTGGNDTIVRRCIAFDNAKRGFVDGNGSQNTRFYNCIAYRNDRDPNYNTGWGFLFESNAGRAGYTHITRGATLVNTISFGHGPPEEELHTLPSAIFASDHNLIADGQFLSILLSNPALDQHSILGNPGFANVNPTCDVDLWVGDPRLRIPNPHFGVVSGLELLGNSPCVDAGTTADQSYPPEDGDGNGTATYDIGAYEYSN